MYKVKKKVHSEAKPDWMVGVLYQIPPKVYVHVILNGKINFGQY